MSIPFHDASAGSYLQVLEGVAGVLDKGASHAAETGLDLQEVVIREPMRANSGGSANLASPRILLRWGSWVV